MIPLANKASGQVTVVDITDAYSVLLTSESYTFVGNTTGAPSGLSCTTQVVAYCGTQQCSNVSVSTVTCPAGISATISNNNTVSPTVTFKTTATITAACEAIIPVTVDGVTINKKFSFAVAKTGATGGKGDTGKSVSSVTTQYYVSTSKTFATGGSWSDTAPTTIEKGKYLWTRLKVIYTNPSSTEYTTATYDSMTDSRIEQLKDSITLEITGPDGVKSSIAMDDDGKIALTGDVMAQRINVDELMARKLTSTGGLDVTGDFYVKNTFGSITQATNDEGYNLTTITGHTSNDGYEYNSFIQTGSNNVLLRTTSTAPSGAEDGSFHADNSYILVGSGLAFRTNNELLMHAKGNVDINSETGIIGLNTSTTVMGDLNVNSSFDASGPAVFNGSNVQINTGELWRNGRTIAFGEWTPTIADATVNSYSKRQGWYLKFGNVVIVGWYMYVKFASGQTANKYKITGLPYTPSAAGSGGGVCSGYYSANQVNFSGWYAGTNGNIYAHGVTNGAAGNKWAEEKIFCGTGDSSSTGTIIYTTSAS